MSMPLADNMNLATSTFSNLSQFLFDVPCSNLEKLLNVIVCYFRHSASTGSVQVQNECYMCKHARALNKC